MTGRALVTGATGMLGWHIAERLREDGWCVRGLVRSRERGAWLEGMGVELVHGSLENADSLTAAADSCDVVFHAAAAIGAGGDWEEYRRGNVEGTGNVIDAASRAGARLVHVSSTSVYGAARYHDEPTDELVPLPELPAYDVYGRSKQDAEAVVLNAHRRGHAWASIVRPPVMYGRGDRQFAPRMAPVLERGLFPRIKGGRTTLALVHARHVAEGAILAAGSEVAGGRVFLLTNDFPVTVTDLIRCAEAGLGRRIHAPAVPMPIGRAGFAALEGILKIIGRGDLARHAVGTLNMLTKDNPFTSDRARSELGWSPSIVPDVGLTEAFRFWKSARSSSHPVEV
jgi:nucleoside-diphosphate-sugar epimerase